MIIHLSITHIVLHTPKLLILTSQKMFFEISLNCIKLYKVYYIIISIYILLKNIRLRCLYRYLNFFQL